MPFTDDELNRFRDREQSKVKGKAEGESFASTLARKLGGQKGGKNIFLLLALIVALISDGLDLGIGTAPITGDVVDVVTGIILFFLIGMGAIIPTLVELAPTAIQAIAFLGTFPGLAAFSAIFGDIIPWFTIFTLLAVYNMGKKDYNEASTFVKTLFWTVVLFAIVIGIIGVKSFYDSGVYSKEYKEGFIAVREQKESVFSFFDVITNPDKVRNTYSLEVQESDEEVAESANLKITSFESARKQVPYQEGEPIKMLAVILADSTEGEIRNLNFECSLEDYVDKPISYFPESQELEIRTFRPTNYELSCTYSDSIFLDDEKVEEGKEAQLRISYQHNTRAQYRAYFLSDEKRLELGSQDYFERYGIEDPLLQANNVMKSEYSPGPIEVAIGSQRSQPFFEGTDFAYLLITIKDKEGGVINEITDFVLRLPKAVELNNKDSVCSFVLIGTDPENPDYNVYTMTSNLETRYADPCEKGRTGDDCREQRKEIILGCDFRVRELPLEENAYSTFILDMDYEYQQQESEVILIQKDIAVQS